MTKKPPATEPVTPVTTKVLDFRNRRSGVESGAQATRFRWETRLLAGLLAGLPSGFLLGYLPFTSIAPDYALPVGAGVFALGFVYGFLDGEEWFPLTTAP